MPHVTIGTPEKGFHRALLAAKEVAALPQEERDALAACSEEELSVMYQLWRPKGAELGAHLEALRTNPVFLIEQALRIRPDIGCHFVQKANISGLIFTKDRDHWVGLDDFTPDGELLYEDGTIDVTVYDCGAVTVDRRPWDVHDLASFIDRTLGAHLAGDVD